LAKSRRQQELVISLMFPAEVDADTD